MKDRMLWPAAGRICPGVTIGADTVVGAGAVVTRDLPAGHGAAGSGISDRDRVEVPER